MCEYYLTNALVGIINSKQALKNYQITKLKSLKNTSAYHIQQTFEYLIKYLIYNNTNYNNGINNETSVKQIFSHNLDLLIKNFCIPNNIIVPRLLINNAKLYTSWEAESRYRIGFSVRINSLKKAISIAEKWLLEIKPLFKLKLNNVNKRLKLN